MMETNLYKTNSPEGCKIAIPVNVDRTSDPYTQLTDSVDIRHYYEEYGYVVIRNLIPGELCDRAKQAFEREVKPYEGYLYRQASGNPEKHIFTEHGYMLNSILNIQDLETKKFPNFKANGLSILTHPNMYDVVQLLLGEEGILTQSMFFEGNPATWAHQDTYYLDSSDLGRMTAAWVAVEDIAPGAGRFYVYPGSHKIDIEKNGGDFDIAFNHNRYKNLVISIINQFNLECRAPALNKGDVLFWNAKTIHGSLTTTQPYASRSSFTAHYIPASTKFFQYQQREISLKLRKINSFSVHHPKNLDRFSKQAIFYLETRFPQVFQLAKRIAIKLTLK